MCLLTVYPHGVLPDTSALLVGAEVNDDGHGFAIVVYDAENGDRIIRGHGLDGDAVIGRFVRLRERYPEGPALFHSRIGTSGLRCSRWNCHPFDTDETGLTVLAHNGILPFDAQPCLGDSRCDTAVLAQVLWPEHPTWSHLDNPNRVRQFEDWLGVHNKVAILTVDPRWDENLYIVNEDAGVWSGGVWYSNYTFRRFKSTGTRGYVVGGTGYLSPTPPPATPAKDTPPTKAPPALPPGASTAPGKRGSRRKPDMRTADVAKSAAESAAVFRSASLDGDCATCQAFAVVDSLTGICRMCQSCTRCGEDYLICTCDLDNDTSDARVRHFLDDTEKVITAASTLPEEPADSNTENVTEEVTVHAQS